MDGSPRRRPLVWLLLALFALGLAGAALGLIGNPWRGGPEVVTERGPAQEAPAPKGSALDIARRFALATSNWQGGGYGAAWQVQHRLAAPRYRRALEGVRPTHRELRAREREGTRSEGEVLRLRREPSDNGRVARVLLWMRQSVTALGRTTAATELYEVRLQRVGGRWRVSSWTVIPADRVAPPEAPI